MVLAEAENALGCLLMESNHVNESVSLFNRAIRRIPDYCGYYNNLGIGTFPPWHASS